MEHRLLGIGCTKLVLGVTLAVVSMGVLAQAQSWDDLRKASAALYMKRDFDGAIALEKKALAIAEKSSPRDPRIPQDLRAIGTFYSLQKKYNEAIPLYERIVALNDAGVPDPSLRATLTDLAAAYSAVGRDADADMTRALAKTAR